MAQSLGKKPLGYRLRDLHVAIDYVFERNDVATVVYEPTAVTFSHPKNQHAPSRPKTRHGVNIAINIAIICALPLEARAVRDLLDSNWDDDGREYDRSPSDPNAYTFGAMGRHNVVLVHMSKLGKASAAKAAENCRRSYPNIELAILAGICGAVPFDIDGEEIILGDVIIGDSVFQYDLGRQNPDGFVYKDTPADSLPGLTDGIRNFLAKLRSYKPQERLKNGIDKYLCHAGTEAQYPGVEHDKLFEATFDHTAKGESCEAGGLNERLVPRKRLQQGTPPQPNVHIGLIASGDTVMKSSKHRESVAKGKGALAFEMESAGIWGTFPTVVIKGVCDYADSHKTKKWQPYAAATAAACLKAFLETWAPTTPPVSELRPVSKQDAYSRGIL
ncbi:nucleoside phosphorylase domain-containing protein [Xylaria sp. FL0043]|nr:nucleoside phosphorylase domain-containing protein [Xylaria sp. FL0043]